MANNKIQHGLGKGLGALLGSDDLSELRKPVYQVNGIQHGRRSEDLGP